MKQLSTIFLSGTLHFIFSCNSVDSSRLSKKDNNKTYKSNIIESESNKDFIINTEEHLKDFKKWYNYTYYNIRLGQHFIGLDVDSTNINKTAFLNRLATGNFVAFKISLLDNIPVYKLCRLINADNDIQSTIKQMALTEIEQFKMEGKELPDYYFTDLNGKNYNKISTKGKFLIIK